MVRLSGKTRIMLREGDFQVLDADGTDGKAAFQLPKPYDPADTDFSDPAYTVWIRVLSPRGSASMYTVAFDGTMWVQTLDPAIVLTGATGKKEFSDVTRELTTIYVDITDDGKDNPKRYGLFDPALQYYAWDYDNTGLRHVQIRFYPVGETP